MKRNTIIGIIIAYVLVMTAVSIALLQGRTVSLFDTQGTIADQEKSLIIFTVLLGCTVVIPVIIMTLTIAWHYREGNTKATFRPEWGGSRVAETVWWLVPTFIIGILAVVIIQSSHALDPYKELTASNVKPVKVQVVALQWRWLFLYPEEKIASINYLKIPVNTPINMTITSDAPMNSFWIPQLSGQIYAMSGMQTKLHIAARTIGDYRGSSANISGVGFSGMKFSTQAVSKEDYENWTNQLRGSGSPLNWPQYTTIAEKTCDSAQYSYSLDDVNLYNKVINKYMDPSVKQKSNQATDAGSAPANCEQPTIMDTITKKFLGSR